MKAPWRLLVSELGQDLLLLVAELDGLPGQLFSYLELLDSQGLEDALETLLNAV